MGSANGLWRTLPIKPSAVAGEGWNREPVRTGYDPNIPSPSAWGDSGQGFIALLGHNLHQIDAMCNLSENYGDALHNANSIPLTNVINMDLDETGYGGWDYHQPKKGGFSLATFNSLNHLYYTFQFKEGGYGSGGWSENLVEVPIGSVVLGSYFDMPHSADLKITMTREVDGVKRQRSRSGNDLVDFRYTKSPLWGNSTAWELYSGAQLYRELSRVGRRVCNMSFNFLSDSEIWPNVNNITNYETSENPSYPNQNTLISENTFFSSVLHKTNYGQLPFIFSGDKDSTSPDSFAIAKFDMNSFKFTQVSNTIYNFSCKIKEIW